MSTSHRLKHGSRTAFNLFVRLVLTTTGWHNENTDWLSASAFIIHNGHVSSVELKFHVETSFLVASSSHPSDILARMSTTSRACRTRGIWRTTRHTDTLAALYTAEDRRPAVQSESAWQAEQGSRPTRPTSYDDPREDVGMWGVSARMSR